ncbi:DNA translocase FtsK [Shimia ponticola]|uniref:DNA translocase FtsK n=1 Tax=Shimia ponticola TaxID=2582893 RepID=UPI0011BDA271|nr:DNA translocase FtsK [Shimia ponticola]
MAYPTQGRDPLFDSAMQAALEKRGKELIGFGLMGLALVVAMMVGSYSPDDPNWMVATDAPVQNWMGRFGAALAAPLFMIIGWGAWGIAVILAAWGIRFALHMGSERALGRLIFAPIALALAAIYAATLSPGAGWSHSFGMGGLFGDTALMMILQIVPGSAALGAKLISVIMGAAILALGLFVLGFTRPELARTGRWMVLGLILIYALLVRILGTGATMGAQAAHNLQAARAERRAAEAQDEELWHQHMEAAATPDAAEKARVASVIRSKLSGVVEPDVDHTTYAADPAYEAEDEAYHYDDIPTEEPRGLRAFMPSLRRRDPLPDFEAGEMPAPELVQATIPEEREVTVTSDDRIKSKIANAISRAGRSRPDPITPQSVSTVFRAEPRLTRGHPDQVAPETAPDLAAQAAPELTVAAAQAVHQVSSGPLTLNLSPPTEPFELTPPEEETVLEDFAVDTAPEASPIALDAVPTDLDAMMPAAAPVPQMAQPRPTIPVAEPKKVVQHPPKKAIQPSTRAKAEAQPSLAFEEVAAPEYEHPPLSLLTSPDTVERHHLSDEALEENARMLENVLDDYGVKGEIVSVRPGPVVTMYELEPAPGLKASRVIGLSDDIARSMSALSARVSTVPGRSVIGIELPNANREKVVLREILSGRDFGDTNMRLPLALGKDIGGDPIVANLAKMPHLLIAGTTGSGKSVAINTMILSLLYKLTPEECRLIMIDPKMLELSVYDGIPHLLSPVVTDPKKAVVALKWVVGEMEDRYRKMSKMGVRNIEGYNGRVRDALSKDEMFTRTVQTGFDDDTGEPVFETEEFAPKTIPYIVVVVDEMADLMMVAGKEIEACIQRLAQMARASGIHLIMATQRPSVDVITGTIKANFPTRISFQVTSKVDSRTILGEMGAEQLLGMGDMLYMAGGAKITRVHGPFCSDEEVEEIVNYLKAYGPPDYVGGVLDGPAEDKESDIDAVLGLGGNTNGEDALYDQAVAIVLKDRKCSTSYIQRKLAIGYNKAARLVEQMEDEGVVSAANHVGKREILVPEQV